MQPAIHEGICQCCFRCQKLPGGRLSKHGYTVEYNFFNGTCWGANELPYELSCEMIRNKIIPALTQQRINLKNCIKKLMTPGTLATYEVQIQLPRERFATKRQYRSEIVEMKIEHVDVSSSYPYDIVFFIDSEGKRHNAKSHFNLYKECPAEPVAFVNWMRKREGEMLRDTRLKHLSETIVMYEGKVKNWKLEPLKEVV